MGRLGNGLSRLQPHCGNPWELTMMSVSQPAGVVETRNKRPNVFRTRCASPNHRMRMHNTCRLLVVHKL